MQKQTSEGKAGGGGGLIPRQWWDTPKESACGSAVGLTRKVRITYCRQLDW